MRDDLAKVGIKMALTPIDFNSLISNLHSDFQYEAMLLGFQSGVPPDPFGGQNVCGRRASRTTGSSGSRSRRRPQEARIDQALDEMLTTQDHAAQKHRWKEIQNIVERSGLVRLAADPEHQTACE